jgi:hypothetical protein
VAEIREGTDWSAWDSFDAYDIGDHQRLAVQIKPRQMFTLTVIHPTDDPNKVYFSCSKEGADAAKHYWTWKGIFMRCCNPF